MSDADGVDISKLSPEEQQHYKKYGKLKKNVGVKKEKKYFDSADYNMQVNQGTAAAKPAGGPLRPGAKKPPLPESAKMAPPPAKHDDEDEDEDEGED